MIISLPDRSTVVDEDFSPEWVIIDLRDGKYYCLNESAAFIWATLKSGPKSFERIYGEISKRFILDPTAARDEVECFILVMEKASLLIVDRSSVGEESSVETNDILTPPTLWIAPGYTTYSDLQDLILIDPVHEVNVEAGWPMPVMGKRPE
jgi:hypothetical protein